MVEATGQRGFHFDDLPRKHHPKSAEVVFLGHITYARSPDEFYILPEWNFDCDCELERNFDPRYSSAFIDRYSMMVNSRFKLILTRSQIRWNWKVWKTRSNVSAGRVHEKTRTGGCPNYGVLVW